MTRLFAVMIAAAALMAVACDNPQVKPTKQNDAAAKAPTPSATASSSSTADSKTAPASADEPSKKTFAKGDVKKGEELVAEFECYRCHEGVDRPKALGANEPDIMGCFGCHQQVMDDFYKHKADNAKWKKNVAHLTNAPSLTAIGKRWDYNWLVGYLQNPYNLRPHLVPSMPRLAMDEEQARHIATYLVERDKPKEAPKEISLAKADLDKGRELLEQKGCGGCHVYTGVPELTVIPPVPSEGYVTTASVQLAPDLVHVRDRLTPTTLVAWLRDPKGIKPDTHMTKSELDEQEAVHLAGYLMKAELKRPAKAKVPAMPKPLDRKVTYAEVAEKVFDVTCRHCHGDPDINMGEGGPGNTGGFGFDPVRIEMTSYARIMAGYVDKDGERRSLFEKMKDGTPRIVASMLARHAEELGKPNPEVRGMPLGMPPVTMEDIQLVVTWIAQGRPKK